MTLLYLTYIYYIIITIYYFIYLENINPDNLFIILLNFIFLNSFPLYYLYFKDIYYSIIISFLLITCSFFYNLKIKEVFRKNKIPTLIYFILTILICLTVLRIL